MRSIEVEGESIEAAVEAALTQLGVTRDQVAVEVLDEGGRGLLGLLNRKARVRVTVAKSSDTPVDLSPDPDPNSSTDSASPGLPATTELASDPIDRARSFVEELIRLLGSGAQLEVRSEENQVVFELSGQDTAFLIGRHGQMLDAIEYLANRVALAESAESGRIVLDAEKYRERRRVYLEGLAKRLASQVRRKRAPITLEPMSPRDRRMVHVTLQNERGVTTKSIGEGYYRRVVISPSEQSTPRSRSSHS